MSSPPNAAAPHDGPRAEHDDLARRLAVRRSIDHARAGLYQLFVGVLSVGLSVKLAWDRWGTPAAGAVRRLHRGPPLFFALAAVLALTLLALAIRSFLRSRRASREEDALFARFRALRATLGLDR